MNTNQEYSIVLFDGVCNYCNAMVQFSIQLDSKDLLRFASLQSEIGKQFLNKYSISNLENDSFVFIKNNQAYLYSDAAGMLLIELGGMWKIIGKFIKIIPKKLRDNIYKWIAKNRYKIFGKKESCIIPSKAIKNKFL